MKFAITASRKISDKKEFWPHIKELVTNPEVTEIFFGGAWGGDHEALLAALNFREDPTLKLTVVVPWELKDQPASTIKVIELADQIVELKSQLPKGSNDSYKKRNEFMVDHSNALMAFTIGDTRSGTYQTIRYAQKQNKPVTIIKVT